MVRFFIYSFKEVYFFSKTLFDKSTSAINPLGSITIAFIDDFCRSMKQPSTIVIDNAPIHHSSNFKDKIQEWEEQGLYVFYLPRYSPHLNLIETLWRKIKYEWLKAHHYLNWHTFATALNYIFCNIGNEFTINFKNQHQTSIQKVQNLYFQKNLPLLPKPIDWI